MPYRVKTWVFIEEEEEDIVVFEDKKEAEEELEHCEYLQPENIYKVVECDDFGKEV